MKKNKKNIQYKQLNSVHCVVINLGLINKHFFNILLESMFIQFGVNHTIRKILNSIEL